MANEFIIKKGLISKADSVVSGSLIVTEGFSGSFSGSFQGDGSSLTGIDPFPFTGDASITGSLTISGSFSSFTLDSDNVVLGAGSGTSMEAGANSNIIVGSNTATSLTTGDFNVILGDSAGAADTNSQKNVLIGQRAGGNATSLSENVFIGNGAGRYGSGLGGNVGIGQDALKGTSNNNGDNNVGIGWQTGFAIEDGIQNVFVGYRSAEKITTGNYNVILGKKSGFELTTGANNITIGPDAGNGVATGNRNIAIGYSASFSRDANDQLVIGSGSLTTISASLATGDIIFYNTASAPNFSGSFQGDGSQLTNLQRPISSSVSTNITASNLNAGYYFRAGGNVTCSIQSSSLVSCNVGSEFEFFQTSSAGNLLFLTGSGVTLNSKNGNITLTGQFSAATLKKVDNDEWDLIGDLS